MPSTLRIAAGAVLFAVLIVMRPATPGADRLPSDNPRTATSTHSIPAACACFAPGTDPAYAAAFKQRWSQSTKFAEVGRWTSSATGGGSGALGSPITLTYSFVPDGTMTIEDETNTNSLYASLDTKFGSTGAWKDVFRDAFAEWSDITGITFVEETSDDGAAWPDSPGQIGVRGDIRIIAINIDGGSGVLAFNYFPNWGDMAIDAAENWGNASNNYRFARNIIAHELGHGLGLGHVWPVVGSKLMEPYLDTSFDGPQDDDIRGNQHYYGDDRESNNALGGAANLGDFTPNAVTTDLALHTGGDEDWYFFGASPGDAIAARATPVGGTYAVGSSEFSVSTISTNAILPLSVEVYEDNGTSLLRSASAGTAGEIVSTVPVELPAGNAGFYVRVFSDSSANSPQRYKLTQFTGSTDVFALTVSGQNADGMTVTAAPADLTGASARDIPTTFTYADGQAVILSVPASSGPRDFDRWVLNGADQPAGQTTLSLTLDADKTATAIYKTDLKVEIDGDDEFIVGESLELTAVASGGTFPYSFAWSPANTLDAATGNAVTATPDDDTTYTVTVTDAINQTASASFAVRRVDALTADAGEDKFVAEQRLHTLIGQAAGGSPPYTYSWSPRTFGYDGGTTMNFLVDRTVTFRFTVTDAQGRTATDTVRITTAPRLEVDAGDDLTIAEGQAIDIAPKVTGGEGPFTYAWFADDKAINPAASRQSVAPRETTTYQFVVTDVHGQEAADEITIRVMPKVEVTIAATTTTIEPGGSVVLEAAVTRGASPYTYRWTPTETLDSPDSPRTRVAPEETTTYRVTVEDAFGTEGTAEIEIAVEQPRPSASSLTNTGNGDGAPSNVDLSPVVPLCGGFGFAPLLVISLSLIAARRRG